ncbi:hypothetical protein [Bacillus pumilus]|uniref:hypothetical protein n=1 Tax=Bacillus pumilus TaxID=1408 RepID=UPI001E606964|nr:hypothetical protein [Bacillus pumilus]MCC9087987.1 hypothetical protein [Bacillus pumilus]
MSLNKYITSLSTYIKLINDLNGEQTNEILTFFTSCGRIEGRVSKIQEFEVNANFEDEDFDNELLKTIEENQINAYAVTDFTYKVIMEEEQNFAIYLEDVTLSQGINTYKVNTFVLFTNQIIGIVPGEFKK